MKIPCLSSWIQFSSEIIIQLFNFLGTDAFSMAGIERSTLPASILIQDGSTSITEKGFAR